MSDNEINNNEPNDKKVSNSETFQTLDRIFTRLGLLPLTKTPIAKIAPEPQPEDLDDINSFNAEDIKQIVRDKINLAIKDAEENLALTSKAIFNDIMQRVIKKQFSVTDKGYINIVERGPVKRRAYVPLHELQVAVDLLLNEKGLKLKHFLIIAMSDDTMIEDYELTLIDSKYESTLIKTKLDD